MKTDLIGLEGRGALVTGAAQGAGRGIALQLARAGAHVALADLDREAAETAAESFQEQGLRAIGLGVDVRDERSVADMVEEARRRLGSLDVLVNNVGNYGGHAPTPITEIGWDFWQTAIDQNLRSTFLCSQAAARSMQAAGEGGAIVNIASLAGVRASP